MNDAIFSTADPFFGMAIPKRMVLQIITVPLLMKSILLPIDIIS